jgi:putative Holliday junction resolvase
MPKALTVIGFDFGLSKIGIAAGQTITKTASSIAILKAHKGVPNWDEIAKIIKSWQPQALVVGIPLNMDGTEQPLTRAARQFAKQLENRFKLPIYEADERLTTREAWYQITERSSKHYDKVDSLAACLILETWMNHI